MKCPKCEDKQLQTQTVLGVDVDQCPSCLGIWFDETELSVLVNADHSSLKPLEKGKTRDEFDTMRGACPRDGEPMMRVGSSSKPEVVVDSCGTCRGIWLDGGEFAKLVKQGDR